MNIIVCGGRDYEDWETFKRSMDRLSISRDPKRDDICIVSGHARGADSLGERYAYEKKWKCRVFPAQWDKYGKQAGFFRNAEMLDYADGVIAFWDGKSSGTAHMIKIAKLAKRRVLVFDYYGNIRDNYIPNEKNFRR